MVVVTNYMTVWGEIRTSESIAMVTSSLTWHRPLFQRRGLSIGDYKLPQDWVTRDDIQTQICATHDLWRPGLCQKGSHPILQPVFNIHYSVHMFHRVVMWYRLMTRITMTWLSVFGDDIDNEWVGLLVKSYLFGIVDLWSLWMLIIVVVLLITC